MRKYEFVIRTILLLSAITGILGVVLITVFIVKEGLPVLSSTGLFNFLGGTKWAPTNEIFGIFPMIVGSALTTLGALIIGVPIGLGCSIYLAELASERVQNILRPGIDLLAGIPSVIYGLYGMVVIVPLIRKTFGGSGFSVLAGSVVLAIMILPTIINISTSSIKSVPKDYKEASLAMGSSHWQAILNVILPSAKSGIFAGIILGLGRAIGETMAVIMITGNTAIIPKSIFSPVRTLTGNIGIEMGYASGTHQQALFATGIVLFVFIMIINAIANSLPRRLSE